MPERKELELYVHIPFCVRKCAYCDFLSVPAEEQERSAYVDALVREIAGRGEGYRDYNVTSVFLGGGTPSVLKWEETARIFRSLRENFHISGDAEITMEVNPGTVTERKAEEWKKCGITRLSIGLQSADDRELQLLGRIHTFSDFITTWNLVRQAGFDNVNIDLISAVPGQTKKSWERTLRAAADLAPEHISAYSLIIEEGTPFYERYGENASPSGPPLPDEDEEREMYRMTARILGEYGYRRYEISNYALVGKECRHNLGYWTGKEYLGLGIGASSLIRGRRFRNPGSFEKYYEMTSSADSGRFEDYAEEIERLNTGDQMAEFMFLGLRLSCGISEQDFEKCFGQSLRSVYGTVICDLAEKGLLVSDGGRVRLTERGIDVSNSVFCEFLI